jgi:hypothetical protein
VGATIDHLLWAAPDLDAGSRLMGALTGVMPAVGGSHAGFGTRNSLLSLGTGLYLEVIAPDPAQSLEGNLGGRIAALPRPGLMTFAIRSDDLDGLRAAATAAGLQVGAPVAMGRTRPDGVRLDWAILYLTDPRWPDLVPFAIDWKQSPHPSASTPAGCTLRDFAVLHPEPAPLAALFAAIGLPVAVRRAAHPGLIATIATPQGEVLLPGL